MVMPKKTSASKTKERSLSKLANKNEFDGVELSVKKGDTAL